jgi:hypothetical protein
MNIIVLVALLLIVSISVIFPIVNVHKLLVLLFVFLLSISVFSQAFVGILNLLVSILLLLYFIIGIHLSGKHQIVLGIAFISILLLSLVLNFDSLAEVLASLLYILFLNLFVKGFLYEN